jgi:heptosyltransferase-1
VYKEMKFLSSILIVKTSSLGDIVQALTVLDDLHFRFPTASIDWAVEASFAPILSAHPLIRRVISLPIKQRKNLWKAIKDLREEKYDLIFDLQGNCKSGAVTLLARAQIKVGYSYKSVREWPNILATHIRFDVSKQQNIRLYYLELIQKYFQKEVPQTEMGVRFKIEPSEQERIKQILSQAPKGLKMMVCPGSKWINKQIKKETLLAFLQQIHKVYHASFFLVWGDEAEKKLCEELAKELDFAFVVEKLSLPTWQNLMNEMDLVIAVDSSALHLCGTTATPSFSVFGPTQSGIFKPIGPLHFTYQGTCPYGRTFEKTCPVLRTCSTGACIREIKVAELFQAFQSQCAFLQH